MDESRKMAIQVIREYLRDLEHSRTYPWKSAEYMQICYSKIAAIKILEKLKTDRLRSPMTIIENFRDQMDHYSYMNEFNSRIFSIQFDASTFILDQIIEEKERRLIQNGQNKIRKVHT